MTEPAQNPDTPQSNELTADHVVAAVQKKIDAMPKDDIFAALMRDKMEKGGVVSVIEFMTRVSTKLEELRQKYIHNRGLQETKSAQERGEENPEAYGEFAAKEALARDSGNHGIGAMRHRSVSDVLLKETLTEEEKATLDRLSREQGTCPDLGTKILADKDSKIRLAPPSVKNQEPAKNPKRIDKTTGVLAAVTLASAALAAGSYHMAGRVGDELRDRRTRPVAQASDNPGLETAEQPLPDLSSNELKVIMWGLILTWIGGMAGTLAGGLSTAVSAYGAASQHPNHENLPNREEFDIAFDKFTQSLSNTFTSYVVAKDYAPARNPT